MQSKSRFIIGIDLGTTNTAVAYVDTRSAEQRVEMFAVPQLVAPGEVQPRRQLPSFVYLPGTHDLGPAETAVPWSQAAGPRQVVGELARTQGARMPGRMIASAKSWLCHSGVDRQAPILPWGDVAGEPRGDDDGDGSAAKLSPVAAAAAVLGHVQAAWNHVHAEHDNSQFAAQEIIVTVPASFDEAARELTLQAAAQAGYPDIVLIEEPQAAFYAWIDAHPPGERARLIESDNHVLVFDIGGGTTDFTLIAVDEDGFSRTAVGDHLLLGGDNIDLTLAKLVEARLVAKRKRKLDPMQWHGLVHACRLAKERLLSDSEVDEVPITVAGRSSRLIGGAMRERIARSELEQTIFEGFFPLVAANAVPQRVRGGLQEFGLPYAADAAVTRHLAWFLGRHPVARIDAVLFNGGAVTPTSLRARVIEQLAQWQPEQPPPHELANELPEMAVAKGAAYYGLVRRGFGARIRGGTPRAFYIGVGRAPGGHEPAGEMAVCLAAKGLEDGTGYELDRDFALVTNRPVSFKLFSSSARDDQPGALVPIGDGRPETVADGSDLLELPPIVTVLRARGRSQVTVHLQVRITELGALEIWCIDRDAASDERWRLSFDMRAGGASSVAAPGAAADHSGGLDAETEAKLEQAKALVRAAFTDKPEALPSIMKELERVLDTRRDEWSMDMTRRLFDALLEIESARTRSANHEQRWLNLAGFCLRPGSGAPLDQWRSKQMWRIFNEELHHPKQEACRLAWWIVWRRIAGGLNNGHQEQLYDRLAQLFLPGQKQKKKWYQVKPTKQEAAEMIRTLANLERMVPAHKVKLGDELVRRLESPKGRKESLYFWALGRIGSRVPLYGPLNAVVPPRNVTGWLEALLAFDWPDKAAFPMAQLGRRTGDRSRDIGEALRTRLADRLRTLPGGERMARLVEEVVALEAREERVALGDTLPAGLRLVSDEDSGDASGSGNSESAESGP